MNTLKLSPGALAPAGTRYTRPGGTAYFEKGIYPVSLHPFVTVHCEHPSHGHLVLNSGHHYTAETMADADALAREHDTAEHPARVTYRDGETVQVVNAYGTTTGTLVLDEWARQYGGPGYGVHTLRLDDGNLFRTEGRLAPA